MITGTLQGVITHIRKKLTSDEQSVITTCETDDNTKRTHGKNKLKDKIEEYKHTNKMKKEEKKRLLSPLRVSRS